MSTKQKPCNCERYDFPHRRDTKCEEFENQGDDIESMLKDDRYNAEMRREFT